MSSKMKMEASTDEELRLYMDSLGGNVYKSPFALLSPSWAYGECDIVELEGVEGLQRTLEGSKEPEYCTSDDLPIEFFNHELRPLKYGIDRFDPDNLEDLREFASRWGFLYSPARLSVDGRFLDMVLQLELGETDAAIAETERLERMAFQKLGGMVNSDCFDFEPYRPISIAEMSLTAHALKWCINVLESAIVRRNGNEYAPLQSPPPINELMNMQNALAVIGSGNGVAPSSTLQALHKATRGVDEELKTVLAETSALAIVSECGQLVESFCFREFANDRLVSGLGLTTAICNQYINAIQSPARWKRCPKCGHVYKFQRSKKPNGTQHKSRALFCSETCYSAYSMAKSRERAKKAAQPKGSEHRGKAKGGVDNG